MTEQKLIEKANMLACNLLRDAGKQSCSLSQTQICKNEKGLGTCSWCIEKAPIILAFIKEAGFVRLAEDQSLPESPNKLIGYNLTYKKAQQDMLKQGWKKVIDNKSENGGKR